MNISYRWIGLEPNDHTPMGRIDLSSVVLVSLALIAPSLAAKADIREYAAVARLKAKGAEPAASEVALRIGDISVPATAIRTTPEIPRNIAIVVDAGPDQKSVLLREQDLAIALINEFSDASTTFTIFTAGPLREPEAALNGSTATRRIRDIAAAIGVKTNVPIYDPIAAAIHQISRSPGLRVVVFIGEGSDGGSKMRYSEFRSLAESNQIAFFAALIADHSLRGAKILRYGWNLSELSADTAGVFLENDKTPKATRRLSERIRGLRLITFEMPSLRSGNYRFSVSDQLGKRLHAQKIIIIP